MLMNLHKKKWTTGLKVDSFLEVEKNNNSSVDEMLKTAVLYNKSIIEERDMSKEEKEIAHVGKTDPKKKLRNDLNDMMGKNIVQSLGTMLDAVVFSSE
jgi:26S proteasome regulatory subunit N11